MLLFPEAVAVRVSFDGSFTFKANTFAFECQDRIAPGHGADNLCVLHDPGRRLQGKSRNATLIAAGDRVEGLLRR